MRRRLSTLEKAELAYFQHTGKAGGGEKFKGMVEAYPKYTQAAIADEFGVSWGTSQRWHKEYRKEKVA